MGGMGDPRGWIDRLVGAALGLLAAAIAIHVAVALARPLLPWLLAGVLLVLIAAAWRAWSRSRW
jgi:hypothetical protein